MFTHGTPATRDAGPNWLRTSESALFEKSGAPLPGQALERKPSKAWARKMATLIRPKNAVTVSIIANSIARPAGHRTAAGLHSQKDSACRTNDRFRLMILGNSLCRKGIHKRTLWIKACVGAKAP